MDEVLNVMDSHRTHGGVQNVTLFLLRTILKDGTAARQAVANGAITRVSCLHCLECNKKVRSQNVNNKTQFGGVVKRCFCSEHFLECLFASGIVLVSF